MINEHNNQILGESDYGSKIKLWVDILMLYLCFRANLVN